MPAKPSMMPPTRSSPHWDQEERAELSNLKKSGVKTLQMVLGLYTGNQLDNFNLGDNNPQDLDDAYAAANVIRRVWEKLRADD